MNETKAAFAERTIRSLKSNHYRYMDDHGYKYIHKLANHVKTLNFRRNCTEEFLPKVVMNSDFLLLRCSKLLQKIEKSECKLEDKNLISKYDSLFGKG